MVWFAPYAHTARPDVQRVLNKLQWQTETARTAGTEKLVTSDGIDLITRLLTLDPQRRTSAKQVNLGLWILLELCKKKKTWSM